MANFSYIQVDQFQPSVDGWNVITSVNYLRVNDNVLLFSTSDNYQIQFSFLSPTAFRVRFNPVVSPDYSKSISNAVVNYSLAPVSLNIQQTTENGGTVIIETGSITVKVGLNPYGFAVFDSSGQLITETVYGRNLVYSNQAVASLHESPTNESYFGLGEKAGAQLDKKNFSLTFFNFDNFSYTRGAVPAGQSAGPLNPTIPLYNTTPFTVAVGKGQGNQAINYSYGIFLDNTSQSYFNFGANIGATNMQGKYYFGALYGELDYYIMVGTQNSQSKNVIADVINQFTQLTGRAALPPMYALGYQQGGYGYASKDILMNVANQYRKANFPIDGLHIDVDFQNNYRTFTVSPKKFPNPDQMFDALHKQGFKCSTNITGIITANPMDEDGSYETPYPTRDNLLNLSAPAKGTSIDENGQEYYAQQSTYKADAPVKPFIYDTTFQNGENSEIFVAAESYGEGNNQVNPFIPNAYPTPANPQGTYALGTYGFYCNMADSNVQAWWGEQYDYLLSIGLDMIWQDMTCPAVTKSIDNETDISTLPLDLMMYDKCTEQYQPNAYIHNSFAINLIEATFKGITKLKQSNAYKNNYNYQKRNFIIARGGYAGVHRYAGLWTGDSASTWEFLAINIPEILNLGISGVCIAGSDIGGFANGNVPDGGYVDSELFTRWMTCGAFLPWYRNHYNGYTKAFQEPYAYAKNIGRQDVLDNCRKYVETRYRLLQLFYDAAYEASQTGMPIARALFLNEANDANIFTTQITFQEGIGTLKALDCQFFVGNDLLVAPVVTQGTTQRDVYLPAGSNWYVFDDKGGKLAEPTAGGQSISWYVPLDLVPVYVREGAIIPVRQLEQYVGQLPQNYLTFFIYPGRDSAYQLYQDDYTSNDFQTANTYRLTQITTNTTNNERSINLKRTFDGFAPSSPYFYIALLGAIVPSKIQVNGNNITQTNSVDTLQTSLSNAYLYDLRNEKILIKIFDNTSEIQVAVIA